MCSSDLKENLPGINAVHVGLHFLFPLYVLYVVQDDGHRLPVDKVGLPKFRRVQKDLFHVLRQNFLKAQAHGRRLLCSVMGTRPTKSSPVASPPTAVPGRPGVAAALFALTHAGGR